MQIDYKRIIFWAILSLVFIGIVIFLIINISQEKKIEILWPIGGEALKAGETYQIKWRATSNVNKVGILLIKGEINPESRWLAKDISAREGKYDWPVFVWEKTGQDYKIAVLEYPWQQGKAVAYSNLFTITGPEFASCDQFSIDAEWPFIPSDYPGLRRVFITQSSYDGNLGNLDGADAKCQTEAESLNLGGQWKAFLGNDKVLAIERISHEGIFVEATPQGTLPLNKTCYRLLGKNFDEFLKKLTNYQLKNEASLDSEFMKRLKDIWLGRVISESKKECLFMADIIGGENSPKNYSLTATCQNWTTNASELKKSEQTEEQFPECYTPAGKKIAALGLGGLVSGLIGDGANQLFVIDAAASCASEHHLLCIEEIPQSATSTAK